MILAPHNSRNSKMIHWIIFSYALQQKGHLTIQPDTLPYPFSLSLSAIYFHFGSSAYFINIGKMERYPSSLICIPSIV